MNTEWLPVLVTRALTVSSVVPWAVTSATMMTLCVVDTPEKIPVVMITLHPDRASEMAAAAAFRYTWTATDSTQ
jgi:hypothetical protein